MLARMRPQLLIPPLLVLATAVVYWDVAGFEFVNFDDDREVIDNPFVRDGLSGESIAWAFTRGHTLDGNWIPLTWLSLTLDAELFGLQAGGYHVTNVVFHALNAVMLYLLLQSMTACPCRSGFVAALFALHPLHVESVAWVAERKDVLSTFFGFLAVAGYVRYARQPGRDQSGRIWYLLALPAFVASLMSKQMLVTLPFLLLLLDYWPLCRVAWAGEVEQPHQDEAGPPAFPPQAISRLLLEKVPFLVITAGFSAVALWSQQRAGAVSTLAERPLRDRIATSVVAYAAYLRKTVWPNDLAVFYPYHADGYSLTQVVGAGCLLVAISAVAIWQVRRRRYLLVGWLWYLGTLVPVIGIVPIGLQSMADRYTYIPLIGVFVAIAWLAVSLSESGAWRRVVLPVSVLVLVACMISSRAQVQYWRDGVTVFARAVAVTGHNAVAQNFLGAALLLNDEPQQALESLDEAIRVQPNFTLAHHNRARALQRLGRQNEAIAALETAVALEPASYQGRTLLADAYRDAGRTDLAVEQYRRVLADAPNHVPALTNLANLLRSRGELQEAISHYQTALQADSESVVTHSSLGAALFQLGRPDDAIFHLREALRLDPEHVPSLVNLGIALAALGRQQEAIGLLQQASRVDPDNQAAAAALEAIEHGGQEPPG